MGMEMVYEVRSDGQVLAQFSSEAKAKREMKRLRSEHPGVRVYSRWIKVPKADKKAPARNPKKNPSNQKTRSKEPITKAKPYTWINDYLDSKGLKLVRNDMTFQDLYTAIVVDLRTMEGTVGECNGRKAALLRGIEEAMDHPAITVRYLEGILKDTEMRHARPGPSELWIGPMGWDVSRDAAEELTKCWRTLQCPFFLAAFRNGVPCDPEERDSDLSVQPTDSGLALCYREVEDGKVYLVLKDIDRAEIKGDRLEIIGRLRDGSWTTRSFGFIESTERASTGRDIQRSRSRKNGSVSPDGYVFGSDRGFTGSYLFDDGTFGYIADPDFDPDDFDHGDAEYVDGELYIGGKHAIGNLYIDRWTKDGEFIQGGCFLYYEGETM